MSSLWDAPNQQAVGQPPPWEEGTGSGSATPAPTRAADHGAAPRLDEMNKQELLEFAKSLDVSPANNDMTKEDIRAGIDAKLGN